MSYLMLIGMICCFVAGIAVGKYVRFLDNCGAQNRQKKSQKSIRIDTDLGVPGMVSEK